ncbi:Na+/H+ antiporter NhaC family protein [Brevibacillus ginsengisoli]|uniref:Na+/H+ antiporter NhaC family protein n=1 Tax=Brevibacillus ginsengisoli TaxID=363854 RepID=UPI003CED6EBA
MVNYIGLFTSIFIIIFGVSMNIFVGYLLIACWLLFVLISFRKGYDLKNILTMSYIGGKKSYVVIKILLLIGAVSGAWMISGTIPGIVYYTLSLISPDTFILIAFLICCGASFLLGSATGTASIVGLPLIIIARSGGVDLNLAAGAIIAGVYFGDRCSPMSSSAVLVSKLTGTDLFTNIRKMMVSSVIPFVLSVGFYYEFSKLNPLKVISSGLTDEILKTFKIEYLVLVPALVILIFCVCKLSIQYAMLMSILVASMIALFVQGDQPLQVLHSVIFGFSLDPQNPLQNIIEGGGVTSMLKASFVILIACALAGIFEGIRAFDGIKNLLINMKLKGHKRYGLTTFISTLTAAFGCSQSIAVVMTDEIMKDCYKKEENYQFALDIENSCILTSALIPWNIAALICTATLNVSMYSFVPYAFYLYIFPIMYFVYYWFKEAKPINSSPL